MAAIPIQIGTAVVWTIPTISSIKTGLTETAADGATGRALIVTSISISKSGQLDETMNATGDIVAAMIYGQSEECTIECFPASTTIALAKSANALPSIGDVIRIEITGDTEEADMTTAANRYWTITAASKNRTNTSKTTWSLTLRRWGGISDQSQLS